MRLDLGRGSRDQLVDLWTAEVDLLQLRPIGDVCRERPEQLVVGPVQAALPDRCVVVVAGRVWGLVVPEVTHRKSEIPSHVGKFAQNLHVGNMAVEAEKKSLQPRSKHARFLAFRGPTRKTFDVILLAPQ